ncbi:hypothetical protein ERO13_D05G084300v2 [Gossypium hirsutum]|uniref:Transcription factor TGA9 isoform X2 n=3 Tax=Gossypium TaxID=3633 RepID=A0ABM3A3C0_GOSHI|nr:transcription factor TGA9-like isoform X2 [Gossypium hirsutum]KAG4145219.1 hypothetical protein ERO13_D05G084300v2 [Gossypium hirsutum]TYG67598.1 hypothetical protein ES288_D05G088600v1 [Gossypium darwinii]TYH70016.1 hypothetical protein ES332_D05G090200v1 [Gossypium tomentosum]
MENHRVGETGLTDSGPSSNYHHHAVLHGMNAPISSNFIHQNGSAFGFGELEEAIVPHGVELTNDEAKAPLFTRSRPSSATLEMLPSNWSLRFQQTPRGSWNSRGESTDSVSSSAVNTLPSNQLQPESPISQKASSSADHHQPFNHKPLQQQQLEMASDISSLNQSAAQEKLQEQESHNNQQSATLPRNFGRGSSSSEKQLDAKTLRRLAQNREAARKSRLRKKAYVQQLESSRIKLAQLEQDLQRTRSQGFFVGGCAAAFGNISSGAAMFDMEYSRWLEDDHRHLSELRTRLHAHLSDTDLQTIVDGYISHYDKIFRLKEAAAKSDVLHLITGMWMTPVERCFVWIGDFRPSELIKMLVSQLDPLTEHQVMGICNLQHSSQQAEEALTLGLEQLYHSLMDSIAGGPVIHEMQQMAVALSKLANLEGFLHQADNLRQQILHQLPRILTVRQTARCFLVIGEYNQRLRALSSLWASHGPPEVLISDDQSCQTTDLQMVMVQQSQNHFSNF